MPCSFSQFGGSLSSSPTSCWAFTTCPWPWMIMASTSCVASLKSNPRTIAAPPNTAISPVTRLSRRRWPSRISALSNSFLFITPNLGSTRVNSLTPSLSRQPVILLLLPGSNHPITQHFSHIMPRAGSPRPYTNQKLKLPNSETSVCRALPPSWSWLAAYPRRLELNRKAARAQDMWQ